MIIVSDTTPVISLVKAGQLELLKILFGEIIIPQMVYQELTGNHAFEREAKIIQECSYIRVRAVEEKNSVHILQKVTGLDAGESEAIVIAEELGADLLLIDERKGRRVAKQIGLAITGTAGILLQAYDENLLTAPEVEACMDEMIRCGVRVSSSLRDEIRNHLSTGL